MDRNWITNPDNTSVFIIMPAGRVDLAEWLGVAPNVLISGRVDANAQVIGDKTGYSLTQTFPTNFSSLSIDASGRIDLAKWVGVAPDALSSGKVPADIKLWLTTAPDALSSGKVAVDLKLWLTAAPAALTASGYVQGILLRWLTDNAGGTPDALSSGKLPADVKLWLTAAPDALSSGKVASDVKLWLAAAPAAVTASGYLQTALLRWLTDNAGGTPNALVSNRVDASVGAVAAGAINAAALNADTDTYQAKVTLDRDSANTTDRYSVAFFKNGQPIIAGITVPTIQIIKQTDGSDLIAVTALTQVASTGLYKYTEATNRITLGAAYYAIVTATIASVSRTWNQPISRDS